jgi:hypothetical protein
METDDAVRSAVSPALMREHPAVESATDDGPFSTLNTVSSALKPLWTKQLFTGFWQVLAHRDIIQGQP